MRNRNKLVPAIIAIVIGGHTAVSAAETGPAAQKLASSPGTIAAEKIVVIQGIVVNPAGNLGSADGRHTLRLKGLVGAGYDSNIYATEEDVIDDYYGRVMAGFESVHRYDDRFSLGADVLLDGKAYQDNSERNLLGGQVRVKGAYKGEAVSGNLAIDYLLMDDPLIQTGEKIKRESYGANTVWVREMATGGIVVNADAHRMEYLEDQGGFVAEDNNYNSYVVGIRYIHQHNDRSALWGRVGFGTDLYDNDNRFQDVTSVSAAVGGDFALGDRSTAFFEAGVDARTYSDEFAPSYDDDSVLAPLLSIGLFYPMNTQGDVFKLRAYTDARNSFTANAMQVVGGEVDLRHRMSEQFTAVINLAQAWLNDYGAAPGEEESSRSTFSPSLALEYALKDGVVVRATGRWTISEARLATEEDYDRTEVIVETAFAF